ncbi:alpha/beta fold hydrolase [Solimonas terrae]|uniref:Alpha/beta fold hydrolase n=1 Tax=Solimonas terrae TaxID=1396819 RepID=A0A6M2BNC3_9GAMM|nr:alpha/beta fold hydrolase [Solimonas terrae]NGY04106.1 alpha/beta fold hydrolase [Solimonas terrae]
MATISTPNYPDSLPLPEVYEGGAGTPLVLIHGFGGNWRMWKPVLPILERHHRVIVPTLPGHSGGVRLRRRATPASIADALAEQLRARGLDQAHVVGQSLGGYMAVEMARRGVARSVLGISPGGAWKTDADQKALLGRIRKSFRLMPYLRPLLSPLLQIRSLRKRVLRDEMEHGDKMSPAEVRGMLHHALNCPIAREFLDEGIAQIEALPADNRVPVRIVWCGNDRVLTFREFGQPFLDRLGLKTHGVLRGCGHNPMYDDPEAVAGAILDFIGSVERETD